MSNSFLLSLREGVALFNGTPPKTVLCRGVGMHIGKEVTAAFFPKPTLVTIGDYCTLNAERIWCSAIR